MPGHYKKTKTPAKKGYLKKTGGEIKYDEKDYPINTGEQKPSIMLDEIEITSGTNYKGVKTPIFPSSKQQSSRSGSKSLTQTGSTMSKASGVIGKAIAKFTEQHIPKEGKGKGVKETIDSMKRERESQFKKVGKVAPSVLKHCGSSRH
tara:strand:+ start:514 stop:957 length:444 start_codon:yes stop_codon:yes gene_type:complete